jgi:TonB-linked SusC/RagA family outer membrane protein
MVRILPSLKAIVSAGFILLFFQVSSQTISGKIVSSDDNEELIGVTIQIKGTTTGTTSDIEGKYKINASPSNTLIFSYVGFDTQEIAVGSQQVIDVSLVSSLNELEEVVILGYGSVRKSDLTGSVATIDKEKLKSIPASNPMDALQGQVSGVQITNGSGAPGSSPTVRIRGVGTPGNPSPLYVVDGVLLNDISFINSADIESITVLKDASALAIYGNRGANGVVIVKTKQGKIGQGSQIAISSSYGVQIQQNRIDLLNGREFAEVINVITPGSFNNLDAVPDTDWQELIFQTAPIQTHTVSISGASEQNQYYFSMGYFGQEGTIPNSDYNRLTVKLNERFSPKEYLSLGTNLSVTPFWQNNTRNDAPFNVYRAAPTIAPFDENGNFNEVSGVGNVLADLRYTTDNKTRGTRIVGQVFIDAYFLDGFTARTSVGVESLREENEVFTPVFYVSPAQQNEETRFGKNQFTRTSLLWENTINYDKEIADHNINAVIGFTAQDVSNEQLNLLGRNLFRDGEDFRYIDPSNIDATSVSNGVRDANDYFKQASFLGRVNYSFNDRYLATFTFRRDGSSKFLADNRYGNFPAIAFGWNAINETFFTLPKTFTNLKVRGSWGIAGNDKINYLAAYSTVDNNQNAVFGTDEQQYFGQSDGALGNPNLKWEEIEQYNIGMEVGLIEQKLTLEMDYYNRTTRGTLIGLRLPDYLGNGTNLVTFNAGDFRNKGVELNLNWEDEVGLIRYSTGLQGTTINNETLKVSGVESADEILGFAQGSTISRTAKGLPIGAYYGYIVDGVFQNTDQIASTPTLSGTAPGDLIFRDENKDGVLNGDDRTYLGSAIPDVIYGLNGSIGYKGFNLTILFQGQSGNKVFNIKETVRPAQYNYENHVLNYWRGEGTSNSEPRPTSGGNNYLPSSRYIQDGSFFRLRSITLSYSFSQDILDKVNVKSAQMYLRGNNVFTLTDFTGYSPEIGGGTLTTGVDEGTYPVASIYTLGIDLTF